MLPDCTAYLGQNQEGVNSNTLQNHFCTLLLSCVFRHTARGEVYSCQEILLDNYFNILPCQISMSASISAAKTKPGGGAEIIFWLQSSLPCLCLEG